MFTDGCLPASPHGDASAIDLELSVERVPDPKGDRVKLTPNASSCPIGSGSRAPTRD
jgi:cyanate lyase